MKNWRHDGQNLMQTLSDRPLLGQLRFSLRSAGKEYSPSAVIPFSILLPVILFLYFDLSTQLWFLKLSGGHLLRIWIPPLILFVAHVCVKLWKSEMPIPLDWQTIMLAVYAIAGLITLFLNEEPYYALKYWIIMVAPIWIYFVILDTCGKPARIELILKYLFFSGFALIFYTTYLQWLSADNPGDVIREVTTSSGQVIQIAGESFYKEKGIEYSRGFLLYSCSQYSGILLFPSLYGVYFFSLNSRTRMRWVFLLISLLMISQIINTLSRTDFAVVGTGLIMLWGSLVYEGTIQKKKLALVFLLLFAGIGFYVLFFKPILIGRILQMFTFLGIKSFNTYLLSRGVMPEAHINTPDPHIVSAMVSLHTLMKNPLQGCGFTYAEQQVGELNRYLFILISSGVVTFLAYALFWCSLIYSIGSTMIKTKRARLSPQLGPYAMACCTALMIKFIYVGLEVFYYWIIGSLAMAWVYATKRSSAVAGRHALQQNITD
jgi:hypothetical protein